MPQLGVTVAVIESERILLIKREDFEVWCLPGGMVGNRETTTQAAVREVNEETGLVVTLTQLVGVYSRVGGGVDVHTLLFKGSPIEGNLQINSEEVLDIRFFHRNELPDNMFWWHRRQIEDVYDDIGGSVVCTHRISAPVDVESRIALYKLRDSSGLSRNEFYKYYFEGSGVMNTEKEIPMREKDDTKS